MRWLGFDWHAPEPARPEEPTSHLYFASDYFDFMYRAAEALVDAGHAYVDEQSADEMRATAATSRRRAPTARTATARRPRTWRACAQMKDGELADGAAVLRAKIDMASPNINLRDPALYRIKRATHHNTGDRWCIYPMYTYAHPIEDALENITHCICTLEFEDQRPFYDWLLDTLCELGLLAQPRPHQYEFARLNVTYVITSKRKLKQLVDERHRRRLGRPAHADDRRPAPARLHARVDPPDVRARRHQQGRRLDRLREPRRRPARRPRPEGAARDGGARSGASCGSTNWADVFGSDGASRGLPCAGRIRSGPSSASARSASARALDRARRLRRGAAEGLLPPLSRQPGAPEVRLRDRVHRLREGRRRQRHRGARDASSPDTKSGTPGRRRGQGQGHDHLGRRRTTRCRPRCASTTACSPTPQPDAGGKDFKASLNPRQQAASCTGFVEPSLARRAPTTSVPVRAPRLLRRRPRRPRAGRPVFNRIAPLRDTWTPK